MPEQGDLFRPRGPNHQPFTVVRVNAQLARVWVNETYCLVFKATKAYHALRPENVTRHHIVWHNGQQKCQIPNADEKQAAQVALKAMNDFRRRTRRRGRY